MPKNRTKSKKAVIRTKIRQHHKAHMKRKKAVAKVKKTVAVAKEKTS